MEQTEYATDKVLIMVDHIQGDSCCCEFPDFCALECR